MTSTGSFGNEARLECSKEVPFWVVLYSLCCMLMCVDILALRHLETTVVHLIASGVKVMYWPLFCCIWIKEDKAWRGEKKCCVSNRWTACGWSLADGVERARNTGYNERKPWLPWRKWRGKLGVTGGKQNMTRYLWWVYVNWCSCWARLVQ